MIDKILKELKDNGFYQGRMISGSKSYYRNNYPWNKVCFNANIFIHNGKEFEKIWYGDLDITKDGYLLKEIAYNNDTIFYVLSEMDGRFGNENTQNVLSNKFWDTTENIIIVDDEYIQMKEKELKTKQIEYKKQAKLKEKEYIKINNNLEIKEPDNILNNKILKEILITKEDLDKHYRSLLGKHYRYMKKLDKRELKHYIKNRNEENFSTDFLLKRIRKELNLKFEENINISKNWSTQCLFNLFQEYDYKFEIALGKKVKKIEMKHYFLCNINIRIANNSSLNIKSFKDNVIYIIE